MAPSDFHGVKPSTRLAEALEMPLGLTVECGGAVKPELIEVTGSQLGDGIRG
jgi:hypothetical protein